MDIAQAEKRQRNDKEEEKKEKSKCVPVSHRNHSQGTREETKTTPFTNAALSRTPLEQFQKALGHTQAQKRKKSRCLEPSRLMPHSVHRGCCSLFTRRAVSHSRAGSDLRRVHHHTEGTRDRRRRQVVRKLCTHHTAVAVQVDDLAPHDAVLITKKHTKVTKTKQKRKRDEKRLRHKPLVAAGAGVNGLSLVDVGNTLAEVEAGVQTGVHTLDADERLLLVLVAEATTEAKEHSAGVQL